MKRKGIIILMSLALFLAVAAGIFAYTTLSGAKINLEEDHVTLYIPTDATYEQVFDSINTISLLRKPELFNLIAKKKNYISHIKPGRYVITDKMTYLSLINLLRSGKQSPVNVTFSIIRTLNDLAGRVGSQIEADSAEIITFLTDPKNYADDGFTRENVISVFIPNTYQFFWNTTAAGFYRRMVSEHKKFWNEERLAKAKEKGLNPVEVSILASIIDDEVVKADEKPLIAGVYLNRLKRGIPLQACPTIKFAMNDFTITRVLYKHLKFESPYNTYMHKGFPPGPVGCPTIQGIDAVLNAEKHDYIYFVAKSDFSGTHHFSKTLAEHNRYAAIYQKELNKRKIFK